MENKLTYEKAMEELKLITADMEAESVSVDELAAKVQRASFLIGFCQDRLRATETEVNQIISQMNTPQS